MAVDVQFTSEGLEEMALAIQELGPALANRVWPSALAAAGNVIARRARTRNYGFRDGTGVRPFDRRQGADRSVRLRTTIRQRRIAAYYGGRRYRRGRSAVFAGGPGARHAHLVEQGHGGPRPARPHPFLTRALLETQDSQIRAFVTTAQSRFRIAAAAVRGGSGTIGASAGRRLARRARSRGN